MTRLLFSLSLETSGEKSLPPEISATVLAPRRAISAFASRSQMIRARKSANSVDVKFPESISSTLINAGREI